MMPIAVAALLCLAAPVFAQQTYPVWYDTLYDQADAPTSSVECTTFLVERGFNVFGDISTYPFVGGAPQIQSTDSPSCGTCWEFQYTDPAGDLTLFDLVAINDGKNNPDGFTVGKDAMNFLTGGLADKLDGGSFAVYSRTPDFCSL